MPHSLNSLLPFFFFNKILSTKTSYEVTIFVQREAVIKIDLSVGCVSENWKYALASLGSLLNVSFPRLLACFPEGFRYWFGIMVNHWQGFAGHSEPSPLAHFPLLRLSQGNAQCAPRSSSLHRGGQGVQLLGLFFTCDAFRVTSEEADHENQ